MSERIVHSRDLANRMSFGTRVLLRLFGRRLNREVFAPVLCRAHERCRINSVQLHELTADFDPTQRGAVGLARELA